MHGDGVTCVGVGKKASKHADCMSWSSALAVGTRTAAINFIILFVFTLMLIRNEITDTIDTIWQHIVWSFYWLYQGVHPDRDASGRLYDVSDGLLFTKRLQPLAGGYFGVLWLSKADIDFIKARWKLGGVGHACFLCMANRTNMLWTNCQPNAPWIASIYTNVTHAINFPQRHRIFRDLPGFGVAGVIPDVLHTKHLGTDSAFCGGVLKYLIWYVMLGSPVENLNTLWGCITEEYERRKPPHRYTFLSLLMIQGSKSIFPNLGGRAAVIKDFVPVLAAVARRILDLSKTFHRDMIRALDVSQSLDRILDAAGSAPILDDENRVKFKDGCFLFGQCLTSLIHHFHPHTPLFNWTEKTHLLLHMGVQSQWINPNLGSCYQGEELMAVARRIIAASCRASKPATACNTAMDRYADGLSLEIVKPYGFWRR